MGLAFQQTQVQKGSLGLVHMLHFRLNPLLFWPSRLCHCLHVRFGRCLTLVAWEIHGSLGSCSLLSTSSLDWALLWCKSFPSCPAQVFFFLMSVGFLVGDPAMPLHCSYYIITSLLFSCYPWAYGLRLLPVHFLHPFLFWSSLTNIPAMSAHFLDSYLFWALLDHIPVVPTHFISWVSWVHLLLFYLLYFHGFLLNPLGFLGLTTPSLPLITFRAYWPLSQPYEFINSFLGLPQLIYFFFTSYYSHEFTTSFFGLPQPICFFFTNYFCVPCWPLFLPFRFAGLYFTIFTSHFFHIVGLLLPLGLLSKVGINNQ